MAEHADKKQLIEDTVQNLHKPEDQESMEEQDISIFPLARIRKLILLATTDGLRSDTIKLISKATVILTQELFLQDFIQKAYTFTKSKSKKTITLQDLIKAADTYENFDFLKDSGILTIENPSSQLSEPPNPPPLDHLE